MLTKEDLNQIEKLMKRQLLPLKKDIKKIKSDINAIVIAFDADILDLKRRSERTEKHVGLSHA